MNADGTDQVRIDPGNPGMHPSWSADGTKIVFERLGGLFYAFADGSPGWVQLGPTMPAGPPFPGWHYPDWSPTGNRIVLSESSNGFVLRLSTIAPDGTGVTALTPPPVERDLAPLNARWSPDGQRVAYTAVGPRWFVAVAVQALAGGDPQELTEFPRSGRAPAWSPSGHAIVFQSHGDLYVTTLDGGILNLTASPDFREFTPDWAP
jgi:Tol biopolymer transport system component